MTHEHAQLSAEAILVARSLYRTLEQSIKDTMLDSLMDTSDAYEGVSLTREAVEQSWMDFCKKWGIVPFPPE